MSTFSSACFRLFVARTPWLRHGSRPQRCLTHRVNIYRQSSSKAPQASREQQDSRLDLDPEYGTPASDRGTQLSVLSLDVEDRIFITKISPYGFTLHNGHRLIGPTVCLPQHCFAWKVVDVEDITEASLTLFTMIEPKPDTLIIGTGRERCDLPANVIKYLRKHKIIFEVHSTEQAVATFNFQVMDHRWVMAALLPPDPPAPSAAPGQPLRKFVHEKLESQMDLTTALPDNDTDLLSSSTDTKARIETKTIPVQDSLAETVTVSAPFEGGLRSPLGSGGSFGDSLTVGRKGDSSRTEGQTSQDTDNTGTNIPSDKR
ncbi:NDUF3-like protein [Mya arenaria]|uniref:NDUF3-like protein n=1 Tax=Mya arenaria TaxID=6604 RepID=A0ABY7G182_MYAAR|nr:uncharacterized protein LOC128216436 [Mya arenaria]WAR27144.1 NDUF3-like protein [Mya arenaria]